MRLQISFYLYVESYSSLLTSLVELINDMHAFTNKEIENTKHFLKKPMWFYVIQYDAIRPLSV